MGTTRNINKCPIHTALSVWESCTITLPLCESYTCREGGQFCCNSDPPPEEVSEPQQRRDVNGESGGMEQGFIRLMVSTVRQLNRS